MAVSNWRDRSLHRLCKDTDRAGAGEDGEVCHEHCPQSWSGRWLALPIFRRVVKFDSAIVVSVPSNDDVLGGKSLNMNVDF